MAPSGDRKRERERVKKKRSVFSNETRLESSATEQTGKLKV